MDPRIEQALAQLDEVHVEVVEFVRGCDEREWREVSTVEGWPVGVVAHHIAAGHEKVIEWLDHLRRDEAVPGNGDTHDEGNAHHAAEFASTTKQQTLDDLETNEARLRQYLQGITAEEMSREAVHGPAGGVVISVERMVGATARHPRLHLEHMRDAVAAAEVPS
ncbi:MAG TPA: DinB family protein [Actinomycetota bacterium]|jgi:hypothetical protein